MSFLNDLRHIQSKAKHDDVFNTQTMLPISEIRDSTVILKDGGLRAIIRVQGINLDLRNDNESMVILEQYKRFINSLEFPLQILVRNTYLDLTKYIDYMTSKVGGLANQVLRTQGQEYLTFMERINTAQGLIYVKEFYVIVPYYVGTHDDVDHVKKPRYQKIMEVLSIKNGAEEIVERYRKFLTNKKALDVRVDVAIDGLRGIGMQAHRISDNDIVAALFTQYNPTLHTSEASL